MSVLKDILGVDPSMALRGETELYSHFYIKRKGRLGRDRLIFSPCASLKVIQRAILEKILSPMPPHTASTAFYYGRSVRKNAQAHHLCNYLYKTDISDFFNSIRADLVKEMLISKFTHLSSAAIYEIVSLTTKDGFLPQGAPTSPHLSNLVLYNFDDYLSRISSRMGATYTRYADDISISSQDSEITDLIEPVVLHQASKLGLTLNQLKTYRFGPKHRKIVTGLDVSSKLIRPPRSFRKKAAHLVRICESYPSKTSKISHRIMGYLSYWESVNSGDPDVIQLKERMNRLKS